MHAKHLRTLLIGPLVAGLLMSPLGPFPLTKSVAQAASWPWPEQVSVSSSEASGDQDSGAFTVPQMSFDGRYVLFDSTASNFGGQSSNSNPEYYIRDRQSGTTTPLPVLGIGQGLGGIYATNGTTLSGDGRHVSFTSSAINLDPRATDGNPHGYVLNLDTGVVTLVTVDSLGNLLPNSDVRPQWYSGSISDDGNEVIVASLQFNNAYYLHNVATGTTTLLPINDGADHRRSPNSSTISGNGRYITYDVIDPNTSQHQLYEYDTQNGSSQLASVLPSGANSSSVSSNAVSDDGRYVAFSTQAGLFRRDMVAQTTQQINVDSSGNSTAGLSQGPRAIISGDGNIGMFVYEPTASYAPTNDYITPSPAGRGLRELYVHDFTTGETRLVTKNAWGLMNDGLLSGVYGGVGALNYDGSLVAFATPSQNFALTGQGGFAPYQQIFINSTATFAGTYDATPPTLGSFTVCNKQQGQTQGITVAASDSISGVDPYTGEYYVDATPEFGYGTPMAYANGNLTGTLGTNIAVGSHTVYVSTRDIAGQWTTVSANFTVVPDGTSAPCAPSMSFSGSLTGTSAPQYGVAMTPFTITASGSPTPAITKTSPLPSGLNFHDNGDGTATISGTPSGSAVGLYTITITASNSAGSVSQTLTIGIARISTFNSIPNGNLVTAVGTNYSLTATAVGYPAPTLAKSGALPQGLSFADNGDGTATVSGTPDVGSGGAYPITFTATNSSGSTNYSATLKVNEAPAITSANSVTIAYGFAMVPFTVTTTGYPAPQLSKTSPLPSGVNFHDNGDGTATISGTPSGNSSGTRTITIKAQNTLGIATQTFTITVTP